MKKEYWIIIGIVAVVLVMCGCAVGAAIILWPNPSVDLPPDEASTEYDLMLELGAVGLWQCVEGSDHMSAGSRVTFESAPGHTDLAYWVPDPNSGQSIEFEYYVKLENGYTFEMQQTRVSPGEQPYAFKFLIDALDEDKMEMYSIDDRRTRDNPAILRRVR
jgi:hypothetical protein